MNPSKNIFFTLKLTNVLSCLAILSGLLFQNSFEIYCQNLVISPGLRVFGTGGNIVIKSNIVNNGSFLNSNDVVVLSGTSQSVEGTNPVTFENLTVASGSSATLNTSGQTVSSILLSDGTLNCGGNITLLSTAAGTALIDGRGIGQVLGNVTMQRYLSSGYGYKYFSSPFQAATVNEFGDDMNLTDPFTAFYKYDENYIVSGTPASGWVNYKTTTNILSPMAGYAVNFGSSAAANSVDIMGVVNNGALTTTLYNHNNSYTTGFNLVGNPYPSPIDWNAPSGWTKNNIDNALYYFKASTTDQYGGTYSTYLSGVSSDGLATNLIPSMQGFLVHVTDGSFPVTGILAFNNNVRTNDKTHTFFKKSEEKSILSYVRLIAGYNDDTLSFDPLVIYFTDQATFDFDSQLDALKLFNTDMSVTNFYSFGNDGSKLSIDALPLTDTSLCNIRLGLKTERAGDVIFKIKKIEGVLDYNHISITDLTAGTNQELLPDGTFTVNLPAGDYQNRFFLNLSNDITDVNDITPDAEGGFKIYTSHGILKAEINIPDFGEGTIKIYNIMGQTLYVYNIYQPGYYEFTPALKNGIYIVSFYHSNQTNSKKLIFQSR